MQRKLPFCRLENILSFVSVFDVVDVVLLIAVAVFDDVVVVDDADADADDGPACI